jgi:hypothetical protein
MSGASMDSTLDLDDLDDLYDLDELNDLNVTRNKRRPEAAFV